MIAALYKNCDTQGKSQYGSKHLASASPRLFRKSEELKRDPPPVPLNTCTPVEEITEPLSVRAVRLPPFDRRQAAAIVREMFSRNHWIYGVLSLEFTALSAARSLRQKEARTIVQVRGPSYGAEHGAPLVKYYDIHMIHRSWRRLTEP